MRAASGNETMIEVCTEERNVTLKGMLEVIEKCALVTGSGASLLSRINADCFLTGDVKYHDAMEAIALKQSIIDIGHYESEAYFTDILQHDLEKLGLSVIISPTKNPFTYL